MVERETHNLKVIGSKPITTHFVLYFKIQHKIDVHTVLPHVPYNSMESSIFETENIPNWMVLVAILINVCIFVCFVGGLVYCMCCRHRTTVEEETINESPMNIV